MAGFFARRKFRKEVRRRLHAVLMFYPGGVGKIERNYPGMVTVMDENCQDGDVTPVQLAVFIAGIILSDRFENLRTADRKALRDQLAHVDYGPFVEADAPARPDAEGTYAGDMSCRSGIGDGTPRVGRAGD